MEANNGEQREWLRRIGLTLGVVLGFFIMVGGIYMASLAFRSFGVDEPVLFWLSVAGVCLIFIGSMVAAWKFW